jgi:hypothetical protein
MLIACGLSKLRTCATSCPPTLGVRALGCFTAGFLSRPPSPNRKYAQCSKRASKRSGRFRTRAQPACADRIRYSPWVAERRIPGSRNPHIRSDAACPHRRRRCAMPACKPPWAISPPARVRACLVQCCKSASDTQYCTWCYVLMRPQAACSAVVRRVWPVQMTAMSSRSR